MEYTKGESTKHFYNSWIFFLRKFFILQISKHAYLSQEAHFSSLEGGFQQNDFPFPAMGSNMDQPGK